EDAVSDILAADIGARAGPQIGRVAAVLLAHAEPIGGLEAIDGAGQAPVILVNKVLDLECLDGALLPTERRIAFHGAARGNLYRALRQRIAVVEVRTKIKAAFHGVDDGHEVPGYLGDVLDSFVARRVLK